MKWPRSQTSATIRAAHHLPTGVLELYRPVFHLSLELQLRNERFFGLLPWHSPAVSFVSWRCSAAINPQGDQIRLSSGCPMTSNVSCMRQPNSWIPRSYLAIQRSWRHWGLTDRIENFVTQKKIILKRIMYRQKSRRWIAIVVMEIIQCKKNHMPQWPVVKSTN